MKWVLSMTQSDDLETTIGRLHMESLAANTVGEYALCLGKALMLIDSIVVEGAVGVEVSNN